MKFAMASVTVDININAIGVTCSTTISVCLLVLQILLRTEYHKLNTGTFVLVDDTHWSL